MKRIIKDVIIVVCVLGLMFLLASCSKEVPGSQQAAENAINTVTAIQESLPKECKTSANQLLFMVAQNEIREVKTHCDNEKAKIEREKIKWKVGTYALLLVMIAYIIKKVMK